MSSAPARPCTTTALLWQNSLWWISTPSATCFSTGTRPLPVPGGNTGRRCRGRRSVSLVDAEHALGYPGDPDLAPDRAPLREFVIAPQRGDAAQPAGPARVRRVGGVEPALHHGEPGLAVRALQLPAVGHAVGEPQRRLAARLELDELGPPGIQLEPTHREAAAHIGLDVHVGAEP